MKKFILLMLLITTAMIEFHTALQNGAFLRYLDEHPNPRIVPTVEYYIGSGYYVFHDLEEAATYYTRIPVRYPQSSLADDAYWEYLQTLDDSIATPRVFLAQEYGKYAALFPQGRHLDDVRKKIDVYNLGTR